MGGKPGRLGDDEVFDVTLEEKMNNYNPSSGEDTNTDGARCSSPGSSYGATSGISSSALDNEACNRWKHFNNAQNVPEHRRRSKGNTQMLGAEREGQAEELVSRSFARERVMRVPTKANLKPPKAPGSNVAVCSDEDEVDETEAE